MENQSTVKDVKAAGEPENKIIAGTDGGDKVKTSTNAVSSKEATAQPQNETEKMLKDIKKKFKNLSKLTMDNFNTDVSEGERLNKLFDATNKIASYVNSMEEYNYILNKLQGANRLEKEMINAETVKLSNYKAKLEKLCREFQANNNSIKDTNKKYVEEETKRREELKKNFESSLGEIAVKLEEQSKGAQEQHQENEELRAKLKDKIQQFEAREKEVLEEIKKKDDENEDRTKGILSKLREIEKDAQASFELKANIDRVEKNENDIKIKIALYSERFPEFENTYKTTYEMQQRFKQEIVKTASRSKTYYNQNTALKQKNERIDAATLEILSENNDLKKKIEETRGIKDKIRNKCIELQKELKEKDKELAALQAQ